MGAPFECFKADNIPCVFRRIAANQRFFTSFSPRRPIKRAISAHLFPSIACCVSRIASSSGVHSFFEIEAEKKNRKKKDINLV
jgi:hypothetical protein